MTFTCSYYSFPTSPYSFFFYWFSHLSLFLAAAASVCLPGWIGEILLTFCYFTLLMTFFTRFARLAWMTLLTFSPMLLNFHHPVNFLYYSACGRWILKTIVSCTVHLLSINMAQQSEAREGAKRGHIDLSILRKWRFVRRLFFHPVWGFFSFCFHDIAECSMPLEELREVAFHSARGKRRKKKRPVATRNSLPATFHRFR